MKAGCCPNTPMRNIVRIVHEAARNIARAIAKTDDCKQSRKDRKKAEKLFAHLKRIMKLDRLRLRGLTGAKDEFLLATTAQNLRRMAKWLAPIAEKRGNGACLKGLRAAGSLKHRQSITQERGSNSYRHKNNISTSRFSTE